jgi:hypothetical protein
MAYEDLSLELLQQLHNEVRDALRKRKGEPTRESVLSYLSPKNPDFMGTGMNFEEYFISGEIEHIKAGYRRQERGERVRRRDAAIALAIELSVILTQTNQATLFAREAIPAVILGDWREVKSTRDLLTFDEDFVGNQVTNKPIFAKFVSILDEVLDGIPKEEPAPVEKPVDVPS